MARSLYNFDKASIYTYTGFLNFQPNNMATMETTSDYDEESWALITQYLATRVKLPAKQKKEIEAYIDRAKLFYDKYKLTKTDSSAALLAYYSTLNLAKAVICTQNPSLLGSSFGHGASFNPKKRSIVKVKQKKQDDEMEQVLPLLYEVVNNQSIGSEKLKIHDLFGCVKELRSQSGFLSIPSNFVTVTHVAPCDFTDLDKSKHTIWVIIKLHRSEAELLRKKARLIKAFNRHFSKIELKPDQRRELFFEQQNYGNDYVFFQSKEKLIANQPLHIFNEKVSEMINDAFVNRASPNFFDPKVHYDIVLPIWGKPNLKINEFLAIYVLIYWASSAIRYDPSLNIIGGPYSKDRIIFNEVLRVCPYLALRHFVSIYMGQPVEFAPRS